MKNFLRAKDGVVAPIFGLVLVVIVASIGMAIDYGRAYNLRQAMQATLDGAIIAAARAQATHKKDVAVVAQSFIDASDLAKQNFVIDTMSATSGEDGLVTGQIAGRMPTYFMGVVGHSEVPITVESAAAFGSEAINLVLVLDTTASMAGTKLETLKTAASGLVDTLHNVPSAEEIVKIGVVPFANYVNVGLSRRTEPWINVPLEYSENVCSTTQPVISKSGCSTQTGTATNDNVPYTYTYETCTNYEYGPETTTCNNVMRVWNGCVGSRNYPLNVQDGSYATPVPGLLNITCSNEVTPATNDKQTVKDAITAITASGDTYIPAGLAWGWRMITKKEPFTEANADDDETKKYIVLMTDGSNSRSPTYPEHNGSDTAQADQLTSELCANIKAQKIEIFTIAFQVTDDSVKSMLEGCASPGGAYYDAIDAHQLKAAFNDIGSSLTKIRLTK